MNVNIKDLTKNRFFFKDQYLHIENLKLFKLWFSNDIIFGNATLIIKFQYELEKQNNMNNYEIIYEGPSCKERIGYFLEYFETILIADKAKNKSISIDLLYLVEIAFI